MNRILVTVLVEVIQIVLQDIIVTMDIVVIQAAQETPIVIVPVPLLVLLQQRQPYHNLEQVGQLLLELVLES